mgnify:CR=1 FL=1
MIPLSELVSTLILDSADGVQAAETTTAARRQAVGDYLREPPGEATSEAAVDRFLRERFPALDGPPTALLQRARRDDGPEVSWSPGETAVRPGNVYVHPELSEFDNVSEFPPIRDVLGVELDDDVVVSNGVGVQTEDSVQRVREAVAQRLGERRQSVVGRAFEGGVPTPRVQSLDAELPVRFDDDLGVTTVTDDSTAESVGRLSVTMEFRRE